jgi:hypothetical protein
MNNQGVKARLSWIPMSSGGRSILPVGIRYCPLLVMSRGDDTGVSWSASVFNKEIDGGDSIATVAYLVDNAPHHLLKEGAEFALYEGQKIVAQGVVL